MTGTASFTSQAREAAPASFGRRQQGGRMMGAAFLEVPDACIRRQAFEF